MASGLRIRAENVWFEYLRGEPVVKDVSLEARPGEVTAIIGPTGCGKSTLLMVLAGLLPPSKGCIYYDGAKLAAQQSRVRRRIGLLFQNPDDQLFNPTVYDEIAYSLRGLLSDPEEIRRRVGSIAEQLGVGHLLNRPPFRLSVGEKKMVALASIMSYNPDVLILDEPTANLDRFNIERVERAVYSAKREGKTVLVASHDLEFVASNADIVYVMDKGRIVGVYGGWEILRPHVARTLNLRLPLLVRVVEKLGISYDTLVGLLRG